jgi:hypothetical protein
MPVKGQKLVERTPVLFAFRLWRTKDPTTDQTVFIEILQRWLSERADNVSVGAALADIVITLMKKYQDDMGDSVGNPVLDRLDTIESLLQQLIRNPAGLQRLVEAGQHYEQTGEMDMTDDILDNILGDGDR